jgi:hypothetical protein
MYDQRRNPDTTERFPEVEVAETGPDALLDAADDAGTAVRSCARAGSEKYPATLSSNDRCR